MKHSAVRMIILAVISAVAATKVHRVQVYRVDHSAEEDIQEQIQKTINHFSSETKFDIAWSALADEPVMRVQQQQQLTSDINFPSRRSARIDAERVSAQRGPPGVSFVGRVSLGTPPQYFRLAFDISSGDTWITAEGANCSEPEPCPANRRYYNPSRSSTFESWPDTDWKIGFSDNSRAKGKLNTDILQAGGFVIDRQVVGIASVIVGFKDNRVDGTFGLALKDLAFHGDPTPIENLIATKGMKSMIGIWLGAERQGGELVFGDSDPARFKGELTYFGIPEKAVYWSVPVMSISIITAVTTATASSSGGTAALSVSPPMLINALEGPNSKQPNIIFDTSSNLILVPPRVAAGIHRYIHSFFFGLYSGYSFFSGAYTVSCTLDTDIWIELGPLNVDNKSNTTDSSANTTSNRFKIAARDIVGERVSGISSFFNVCFSKIQATKSDDDDWLFGDIWFINNYMTLDHKNRLIGIAPAVRPEEL